MAEDPKQPFKAAEPATTRRDPKQGSDWLSGGYLKPSPKMESDTAVPAMPRDMGQSAPANDPASGKRISGNPALLGSDSPVPGTPKTSVPPESVETKPAQGNTTPAEAGIRPKMGSDWLAGGYSKDSPPPLTGGPKPSMGAPAPEAKPTEPTLTSVMQAPAPRMSEARFKEPGRTGSDFTPPATGKVMGKMESDTPAPGERKPLQRYGDNGPAPVTSEPKPEVQGVDVSFGSLSNLPAPATQAKGVMQPKGPQSNSR